MTPSKPKTRLFVDAGLAAGVRLDLPGERARYLAGVLRMTAGEDVALFNGLDGEWSAAIEKLAKGRCTLAVGARRRPQVPEPGPWLAFAPIKKTETDFLVEKATELGVQRLCPVFTRRTNSARVNVRRLRAHVAQASEQCERLTVPGIGEPVPLERLAAEWPRERRLLVLDESGGGRPIVDVLSKWGEEGRGQPANTGFLSGPEGGFETGELDALRELDFVTAVGLGPRILRAETAALAAMACWQAFFGGDG